MELRVMTDARANEVPNLCDTYTYAFLITLALSFVTSIIAIAIGVGMYYYGQTDNFVYKHLEYSPLIGTCIGSAYIVSHLARDLIALWRARDESRHRLLTPV